MIKKPVFLAGIVAAFILGALAGIFVFGNAKKPDPAPPPNSANGDDKGAETRLKGENTDLRRQVEELKNAPDSPALDRSAEIAGLKAKIGDLKAQADGLEIVTQERDKARAEIAKMFENPLIKAMAADNKTLADLKVALEIISPDWATLAENSARMSEVMDEVVAMITGAKPMDKELLTEVGKLNAPILDYALKTKTFIPSRSDTVLAAFTHPVSQILMIEAALKQEGLPLAPEQLGELDRLGEAYMSGLNRTSASYDENTTMLRKVADEYFLRLDFMREVRDHVVSAEQHGKLWGHSWVGCNGTDVFSPAIMFQQTQMVHVFTDDQAGRVKLRKQLAQVAGIGEENALQIQELGDAYLARMRPRLDPVPAVQLNLWHEDDLALAFHAMLEFQEKLIAFPNLSPQEREAAKNIPAPIILRMQESLASSD